MAKKSTKTTKKQEEPNVLNDEQVVKSDLKETKKEEPVKKVDTPKEEKKEPEKVFVSDYRELVKVEGSKDTQRGRLYYGVKR